MKTKICTVCKEEKPLSGFYFDKRWNSHVARCKECRKEYNKDNANRIRENNRRRRERNRELIRKQQRESYWRNKKLHMLQNAKRNRRGLECHITKDDIVIPDVCPIFKVPFDRDRFSPSLDRIDNTKGYTPDNIWVISKLANTMKNSATLDELKTFCTNMLIYLQDDIVQPTQ